MKRYFLPALLTLSLMVGGCLESLEPEPEEVNPTGTIRGRVTYTGPWPSEDRLVDLRFVAMKYVPRTESDIFAALLTGDLVSSAGLRRNVEVDTFSVQNVPNGMYVYNGIARQKSALLTDWDALGIYTPNNGRFEINGNEIFIEVHVDFNNLPPFPPNP